MSQETFIRVYDEVAPKRYCDEIIELFRACQHVYSGMFQDGGRAARDFKLCDELHIRALPHLEKDERELHKWQLVERQLFTWTTPRIVEYVREFKALEGQKLDDEGFRFKRYPKGQGKFGLHIDATPTTPTRAIALILYLNDVTEGGETEFVRQGVKVEPRAGRIVISPTYWTHPHQGNIPLSDDKYIVNNFVVMRPISDGAA